MDLNVLHLGGCTVVLGTHWLSILGDINWDFKLLTMKFLYLGNRVLLKGLHPKGSVFSEPDRFFNDFATRKGLVLQILVVTPTSADEPLLPTALSNLLDQFSKVFDMPSGLPPFHGHKHQIILQDGTPPVCERP